MKKFAQDCFIIAIASVFMIFIFWGYYIENIFNYINYLWIFNIIIATIILLYWIINYIKEKKQVSKIENYKKIKEIDFKYYREIIKEYSPGVLSFILDGIELEKDISASIIYLIYEGYLELTKENKLEKTNKDINNLPKDLQLILEHSSELLETIKRKTAEMKQRNRNEIVVSYSEKLKKQWCSLIEEEATEKELVSKLVFDRGFPRILSIFRVLCIVEMCCSILCLNIELAIVSMILTIITTFIKKRSYEEKRWVKTKKGYEIYLKIVGLKNYIEDFSEIKDKDLNQINLWEEYLIYAIIFNNVSNLNKENLEFYKRFFED